MRQIQAGNLDQLAFGADAREEQHEMQLEKDNRIDGRATGNCVAIGGEIAQLRRTEHR